MVLLPFLYIGVDGYSSIGYGDSLFDMYKLLFIFIHARINQYKIRLFTNRFSFSRLNILTLTFSVGFFYYNFYLYLIFN